MTKTKTEWKRYQLVLPKLLYEKVATQAEKNGRTVVNEIRSALNLWLMVRRGEVELRRPDGTPAEIV